MKKLLALLTIGLAFTLVNVAQTSSASSTGQSEQTSTTTKAKSKKSSSSETTGAAASDTGSKKAKKESTLTGCLSADESSLSNGRYKKGVKVEPADKLKGHGGHQVELKGQWKGTGAEKTFEVASMKHLAATCKEAPGGGTTGTTKKGKKDMEKGKESGATPKQ